MSHNHDPFARAENSAREWLAVVGAALGTRDRRYTYRVLRAWLHILRDRLTVEASAHFAAQLPELWRGTYYDGWVPNRVPVRYHSEECLDRVAAEATIRRSDVRQALAGVSAGMRGLLSEGALDHALGQLPRELRGLFTGAATQSGRAGTGHGAAPRTTADTARPASPTTHREPAGEPAASDAAEWPQRLHELQRQIDSLTTVVTSLSRDLRDHPAARFTAPPTQDPEALAAANEVLLPRQT